MKGTWKIVPGRWRDEDWETGRWGPGVGTGSENRGDRNREIGRRRPGDRNWETGTGRWGPGDGEMGTGDGEMGTGDGNWRWGPKNTPLKSEVSGVHRI